MGLILRVVVNALALWAATALIDGVEVGAGSTAGRAGTLIVVAILFGLVNAVVKPLVELLSLPLLIVTLGLFTLVVNALMLLVTSWIAGLVGAPFAVDGFVAALLGALVISMVSWLLNIGLRGLDHRRERDRERRRDERRAERRLERRYEG